MIGEGIGAVLSFEEAVHTVQGCDHAVDFLFES